MTVTKEARVVVPLTALPARFERMVRGSFNGFTRTFGQGYWYDPKSLQEFNEDVYVYDIAMEDRLREADELRRIVREWGRDTQEKAVYVRFASGEVEIINVEP